MSKRVGLWWTSIGVLLWGGCSTTEVDCSPLVAMGSRCVCPEGSEPLDEWACMLSDGGVVERPGRPDAGAEPLDGGGPTDAAPSTDGARPEDTGIDSGPEAPPDVALVCAGPTRSPRGFGGAVTVGYDIVNNGGPAGRTTLIVEFFDSFEDSWTAVREISVAASIPTAGRVAGEVEVLLPPFVVFGENEFRCTVNEAAGTDSSPEDNTDGDVLQVEARPNLRVVAVVPSAAAISSYDPVAIRMENAGEVAVPHFLVGMQYEEPGGGGGSFIPGGPVTYEGTREGACNASVTRCGPLLPGDQATVTTGWCAFASPDAVISGGGFAPDEVDRSDNVRDVPSTHYPMGC